MASSSHGKPRTWLLSHLEGRTGLVETPVEVEGASYRIAHAAAADALIDEEEFARDERLPYWAELWPSAVALACRISKVKPAGTCVIELGCGVGLPSVAALDKGLEVTATDHYQAALDFTSYNARANLGREPETRLLDWHAPGTERLDPFDLVLAADVLYEPRNVPALSALIPTLLTPGGEILLADPHRKDTPMFLQSMRERGFHSDTEEYSVELSRTVIPVHRLRRA